MKNLIEAIYRTASGYWDTRYNHIHVPIAYRFAEQLLGYYPGRTDGFVVLPAILLHDVGWKMVPEESQLKAYGPKATDPEAKRLHEMEGVRIAALILGSLRYDQQKTQEILAIIDGHDTRLMPLSLNDQIVKDSDKIWRFTPIGVAIDSRRFALGQDERISYLAEKIDSWLFTSEAKILARAELSRARLHRGNIPTLPPVP